MPLPEQANRSGLFFEIELEDAENEDARHEQADNGQGDKKTVEPIDNMTFMGSRQYHIEHLQQHKNGKEHGNDTQYKIGKPVPEIGLSTKNARNRQCIGIEITIGAKITHEQPAKPKQDVECISYIYQYLVGRWAALGNVSCHRAQK